MGLTDISVPPELLARACQGENAARQTLYTALAPGAATLIRRLVGHRELAEDLFQDTMVLFFERLGQFRGEAPLGAWLRQIAVSRCLMHLRSPWQRARLCLEPVDAGVAAEVQALVTPGYSPEQLDLERALARLAPTARAIVWMYEVEGYSHQEIAAAFGRSVSFSKSQLARAHARLRAWLEPQESHTPCTMI
ncbi:MAG: RNA polymerase sigma factor [Gammaproteobacteria bacterium]|nr:RNA polymerase sigma factor [Gammaproteobacteria bacterium]MBV9696828.1 RNA polymerase sigma factor [Gammaproteobacteria bacterium]